VGKIKNRYSSDGVLAKKHLGQHFLNRPDIAQDIAELVSNDVDIVIEIGPGTGVLTQFLYPRFQDKLYVIELDLESVDFLRQQDWAKDLNIIEGDFLEMDLSDFLGDQKVCIVGNYPYNISTQIVFKLLEESWNVVQFCGMFQKEVAERLSAGPGNKQYGITSVLLQAAFKCKYSFTVDEFAFIPPPKVKSGVIDCYRFTYLEIENYNRLKKIVKQAFSQRRKTLNNALKPILGDKSLPEKFTSLRAEALSVEDFWELVNFFYFPTH